MLVYAILLTSLVAFLYAVKLTGLASQVRTAANDIHCSAKIISDTDLSESCKESAIQAAAIRMFSFFFTILIRSMAAFAVALLVVLVSSTAGLATIAEIKEALNNWILIVSSIAIVPLMWHVMK